MIAQDEFYQDCVVEGYSRRCARDDGLVCPEDECDALNGIECECGKEDCLVIAWIRQNPSLSGQSSGLLLKE